MTLDECQVGQSVIWTYTTNDNVDVPIEVRAVIVGVSRRQVAIVVTDDVIVWEGETGYVHPGSLRLDPDPPSLIV